MAIIQDGQGNLIDTENRIQFGNEKFDSEPYEYTPDYLGAGNPIDNIPDYSFYGNRGDFSNTYDPAFGTLRDFTRYDRNTGKPTLSMAYSDYGEEVPSLQRALGNSRFAMAPELTSQVPQGIDMAKPQIDPNRIPGRIQEAVEPQYRIRDQLNRDFLQGGLFKDAKNSLRETGTALNEDFGNIKGKIGSGINSIKNNPVTKGLGTAFNLLKGNVPGMLMSGLGAIMNRDPNAPSYQQYSPQSYLEENNLSNIYNANPSMINDFYDSNPESDDFNTTRFDRATTAFGKSRALFGPNGIAATKAKMAAAKADKAKAVAQAYKEKQAADIITAANNPYNPDGSRAAYNYAGRDNAQGTHTSTMSNSQAQTNQDRGRGRYQNGGLASMFTRRR